MRLIILLQFFLTEQCPFYSLGRAGELDGPVAAQPAPRVVSFFYYGALFSLLYFPTLLFF